MLPQPSDVEHKLADGVVVARQRPHLVRVIPAVVDDVGGHEGGQAVGGLADPDDLGSVELQSI